MAVDERSRHELYRRLEDVLGSEAATTLIEHLPPVGWADVATKQDVAQLEQRIDLRFARVDDRFAHLDDVLAERFNRIDDRFNLIDDRFKMVDEQFKMVDRRFNVVGDQFKKVDEQFKMVGEQFTALGWRFDGLDDRIKASGSELRAAFEHELRSQTTTMVFGLVSVVLTMAALAFALVRFT